MDNNISNQYKVKYSNDIVETTATEQNKTINDAFAQFFVNHKKIDKINDICEMIKIKLDNYHQNTNSIYEDISNKVCCEKVGEEINMSYVNIIDMEYESQSDTLSLILEKLHNILYTL